MSKEWRKNVVIPIFKGKEDIQECGNYKVIQLMSHSMKIWENITDKRIRRETSVTKFSLVFA